MKTITTLSVAAILALVSQFALAQGMGMGAPNFSAIDSDSNGELTAEELAAHARLDRRPTGRPPETGLPGTQ